MSKSLFQLLQAARSREPTATTVSKFRAKPTGGYASQKEYRRACQLKAMQRSGLISCLREQVPFELIPAFTNDDGTREHAVRYIADFVYVNNASGQTIVEDVKGFRTREYIIKRKLMQFIHGIRITEV